MSKSTRTPHLQAGKPGKPGKPGKRATARPPVPGPRTEPTGRPRMIGGIDYGPAFAAVHDFAAWAFDLAARDVADWPEGQRRVDSARRFVLARVRGKHPRRVPVEDVLFTAGLLGRIFEAKLGRSMSDLMAVFAQLGFSTDPVPPGSSSSSGQPQDSPGPPQGPPGQPPGSPGSPITPLRPSPGAGAARPAPVDACNEYGQLGARFRVAA
jgi:hypothetical protein